METSHNQPLSIESFSYSWLVNLKPSLEGLLDNTSIDSCSFDDLSANSFIEMDPTMPPSKRFLRNSQDFKFDFPISQSPADLAHQLVHADQLFANGYLMPLSCFVDPLKLEAFDEASDNSSSLNSHLASLPAAITSKVSSGRKLTSSSSLRKCRKLSKRLFQKYLNFLVKPLYRRIRGSGGGRSSSSTTSRANHHHHHHQNGDHHHHSRVHSWVYSAETSPRISVAYSADDCWRKSCDSESSIYEAVLHCKRSIGK
ncbi:hypothetical protein Dsin_013921 [Dipteronia sinensis]|uniref:Membrane-associated kinase regulator 6 n=1 Tax=Dipteronia sinensis TaxID=43782 RepID=A0AAE0E9G1_9ROSI|nr:hypothetical protein Dsin_013921 [Dipteronia sinensis]